MTCADEDIFVSYADPCPPCAGPVPTPAAMHAAIIHADSAAFQASACRTPEEARPYFITSALCTSVLSRERCNEGQ